MNGTAKAKGMVDVTDDMRAISDALTQLSEMVAALSTIQVGSQTDPAVVDRARHMAERATNIKSATEGIRTRLDSGAALRTSVLEAQRIGVNEPDGTLRVLISSQARLPKEIVLDGKTYPHDRQVAGLLFYNDEGTECGGLVFHGEHDPDGGGYQMVTLAFDQLDQDQVIQIIGQGHDENTALIIRDVGTLSLGQWIETRRHLQALPDGPEKEQAIAAFRAEHGPRGRLYAGKANNASVIELSDQQGRVRIALRVEPDGDPSLRIYAEDGSVINSLGSSESTGAREQTRNESPN